MNISDVFKKFLSNLKIDEEQDAKIRDRYQKITKNLNEAFRETDSKTDNCLRVGSYGRWTAIKGVSDLDMLYIMPHGEWGKYKNAPKKLLTDAKSAIAKTYTSTDISIDRCVVAVDFIDYKIEVQPVFESIDNDAPLAYYQYPDTYDDAYKITKPRHEIAAMKEFVDEKNNNLRRLCKMARAWKNQNGIGMGGLLIDTLAYNFLKSTSVYDNKNYACYDEMSRDFFEYLKGQPNQEYYKALGSNQNVKVKDKFQAKAKKAYKLCEEAIDANSDTVKHKKWKKIYGSQFPSYAQQEESHSLTYDNTEQFIEDIYNVDIRYALRIDCEITKNNFRSSFLSNMLMNKGRLPHKCSLKFYITLNTVPKPYVIKWKVLNRGVLAQQKNQIRGQILDDSSGCEIQNERTSFDGHHLVECYVLKDNTIVARSSIDVPIKEV